MKPIIVRGAGDIATGTIFRLCRAGYPVIALDIPRPSAIRRTVAFCQAIYDGTSTIEGMTGRLADNFSKAWEIAMEGNGPAILVDEKCDFLKEYHPWFLVDAILAKKNMGTTRDMADVTVALGPGFEAGVDVDYVVETMRGHRLGKIYTSGTAMANTGIPGVIAGYGKERVMHSPATGIIHNISEIGDVVEKGQVLAQIEGETGKTPLLASLDGVLRGIITDGYPVFKGLKIADIDPRISEQQNCFTISDKARAIAGSVLELAAAAEHQGANCH